MKKLILLIIFSSQTIFAYLGVATKLDSKEQSALFKVEVDEKQVGEVSIITKKYFDGETLMAEEVTALNRDSALLVTYSIDQKQLDERYEFELTEKKVLVVSKKGKSPTKNSEIDRPKGLVAPGSLDKWIEINFELLKKEKAIKVPLLVWERQEVYDFVVKYEGQVKLGKVKAHKFTLTADNPMYKAFISPITVWKSLDLTKTLKFTGRSPVKQVKGPGPKNLDVEIKYIH